MVLVVSEPLSVELGVAELETFEERPSEWSTTVSGHLTTHTEMRNWYCHHSRKEKLWISYTIPLCLCRRSPSQGVGLTGKSLDLGPQMELWGQPVIG